MRPHYTRKDILLRVVQLYHLSQAPLPNERNAEREPGTYWHVTDIKFVQGGRRRMWTWTP